MPTAVVDRPHSRVTPALARAAQITARATSDEPTRPACADRPDVFLHPALESEPTASAPVRIRRQHATLTSEATEVCAACPLLSACLYRAVVEVDVAGIVAGTTERQRAEIRARLGIRVEPEDFDTLAGVVGRQRAVDHDEVVRLRRNHPDESLDRIARRLGCSLSTVKRHLRKERNEPTDTAAPRAPKPSEAQVRRAAAETLAEISGSRRVAA